MKTFFEPFGKVGYKAYLLLMGIQLVILVTLLSVFSNPIIPSPVRIFESIKVILSQEEFYSDLFKSLLLTLKGMGIAVVISMIVSYGYVIVFLKPLAKLVSLCRYLTVTGLIYVFTILSKDGDSLKINILLFGIVPFFVTSFTSVIASIQQQEYDLCTTLRFSKWRTLYEVIIIGRLDQILEVIRQNFAICWMMITTVEGLAMSEGGVGTIVIKAAKYLDMPKVLASLLIILVLGILFDMGINKLRKVLFPYVI